MPLQGDPLKRGPLQPAYVECPFCAGVVNADKGMLKCPECGAVFRLDKNWKSVFVDRSDVRLPIDGTVCVRCGLVQDDGNRVCRHCGVGLCSTVQ